MKSLVCIKDNLVDLYQGVSIVSVLDGDETADKIDMLWLNGQGFCERGGVHKSGWVICHYDSFEGVCSAVDEMTS